MATSMLGLERRGEVHSASASGDVIPVATIGGAGAGLGLLNTLMVDGIGRSCVASRATNAILAFAAGSTGRVAPAALIAGASASLNASMDVANQDRAATPADRRRSTSG